MVKTKDDLTGVVFDRLTVIKQVEDKIEKDGTRRAQWLCICSCENKTKVVRTGKNLKNKTFKSCGCYERELAQQRCINYNANKDHTLNTYNLSGEIGIGWTLNTNNMFYFDIEDYDKIKQYRWHEYIRNGYHTVEAWDPDRQCNIKMHWVIFGKYCDHRDRNPLNNRKYNLRNATITENVRNKTKGKNNASGIIGVCWDAERQKWMARIGVNKKNKNLGRFANKEDAIKARLNAEIKYFGEFAPQKHLFKEYEIADGSDSFE